MSKSMIDQLLEEAENELLEKDANDENGAPDTPTNSQGGNDILSTAQSFLQEVEQFKTSVGEIAAGASGEGEEVLVDPNTQQQVDPNAQPQAQSAASGSGGVIIARPDGTQIKVAALMKLAASRGLNLFKEV